MAAEGQQHRKTALEQLAGAWPLLVAIAGIGTMVVTTQVSLSYISDDVSELKGDLKDLGVRMDARMRDRFTGADHDDFVTSTIAPIEKRLRLVELVQAQTTGRGKATP